MTDSPDPLPDDGTLPDPSPEDLSVLESYEKVLRDIGTVRDLAVGGVGATVFILATSSRELCVTLPWARNMRTQRAALTRAVSVCISGVRSCALLDAEVASLRVCVRVTTEMPFVNFPERSLHQLAVVVVPWQAMELDESPSSTSNLQSVEDAGADGASPYISLVCVCVQLCAFSCQSQNR